MALAPQSELFYPASPWRLCGNHASASVAWHLCGEALIDVETGIEGEHKVGKIRKNWEKLWHLWRIYDKTHRNE